MSQEDRLLTLETMAQVTCEELGEGDVKVGRLCIRIRNLQDTKSYAQALKDVGEGIETELTKIPRMPDANAECNALNGLIGRLLEALKQAG